MPARCDDGEGEEEERMICAAGCEEECVGSDQVDFHAV